MNLSTTATCRGRGIAPAIVAIMGFIVIALAPPAWADPEDEQAKLIAELNNDTTIRASEQSKTYKLIFDAFLKLTPPPFELSTSFNQTTIYPGMDGWAAVSSWAEANPEMAKAILGSKADKKKQAFGLPYGADSVDSTYREAGLIAVIGVDGNLRKSDFKYMHAVETIAAFAAAEQYRLLESGKTKEAMDLNVAHLFLLRQFCDRIFHAEKEQGMMMLIEALSNLRDQFYLYRETITEEQFTEVIRSELPALLLLRRRLQMPEGDRIVAQALIRSVFDEREQPIEERFAQVFGSIQASDKPLELFGAVQRWQEIAAFHASYQATRDRLTLVYDDWWRRWQALDYEPILDLPTEYERLNPVRYALVAWALDDIEGLFPLRNLLIASINGTALAGGLCAYHRHYGAYPNDHEKIYGQFVRRYLSDVDPYDIEFGPFKYRLIEARTPLDTPAPCGRLWIEPGECLLYARGEDHTDQRGATHAHRGEPGTDVVVWPPIKGLCRDKQSAN